MSDDNVIDLKNRKPKDPQEIAKQDETDFDLIARKNKENKERIERERLNANKGVLRSYRLKWD